MKRILTLLTTLSLAGCAGNYSTTFDRPADAEPVKVQVAPIMNQEEMSIQFVQSDTSGVGGQYGLIGALVSATIDAAVNASNARKAERKAETIREMTADYDLVFAAQQSALNIGQSELWTILAVNEPIATEEDDAIAAEMLASSEADAVVQLSIAYALTPSLQQLRADLEQEVYLRSEFVERGKARAASRRLMTYLSPVQTLDYRPFREGEKQELLEALRADYAALIEARPEEADDLQKALEKELEELEDLEQIPDEVAIREGWSTASLTRYLDQSVNHLAEMVRLDWTARIVPEQEDRTKESFTIITQTGMGFAEKGRKIGQLDSNTIYRSQWGSIYSVPAL